MLVVNVLKKINCLNDYRSYSQNYESKFSNSEVQLNIDIILSLNKIKCLEIEYFNKYESCGIAFILYKRLLCQPPSKTWGSLGKDLVSLLRYWLYALRKNVIAHNRHWWVFLKQLLIFIKDLRLKDRALPNILVEETGSSLLDLTACEQMDEMQRFTVLYCFNMCTAESSKECRLRLIEKLEHYFINLAEKLPTCGHFPTQLSIMETLLRWLVNRQDVEVRRAAAKKWFKQNTDTEYVRIFITRPWLNFKKDARDFLNVMNEGSELVTSVVCNSLTVGNINLLKDRTGWLDVNAGGCCLTAVVEPDARAVGLKGRDFEVLTIPEQKTVCVYMQKDAASLKINIKMSSPPHLAPSGAQFAVSYVTAILGDADLPGLHKALKAVFAGKYLSDDSSACVPRPPVCSTTVQESKNSAGEKGTNKRGLLKLSFAPIATTSSDQSADSLPPDAVDQRRVGQKGTRLKLLKSLSTTSNLSLGQLHDKLEALPPCHLDRPLTKVSLRLDLSNVLETSDPEQSSLNDSINLLKPRPDGNEPNSTTITSHSNEERNKLNKTTNKQKNETKRTTNDTSLLLSATLGSANALVVNEHVRLPKQVDYAKDNIVDLVIQEALKVCPNNNVSDKDGSRNTVDTNVEVIEDTQFVKFNRGENTIKQQVQIKSIKSSLLNNESTKEIDNIQKCYVNLRNRNIRHKNVTVEEDIDMYNNNSTQIDMSRLSSKKDNIHSLIPPLPTNINKSLSEPHDSFDKALELVHDPDVMECLHSMLNKVCSDLNKFSETFTRDHAVSVHTDPSNIIVEQQNVKSTTTDEQNQASKHTKKIKLTYKIESLKKKKSRKPSKKGDVSESIGVNLENSTEIRLLRKKLSPKQDQSIIPKKIAVNSENNAVKTLSQNKRKLYSSKDDQSIMKNSAYVPETEEDDIPLNELKLLTYKTPNTLKARKPIATCYNEIEKKQQSIRQPRFFKYKAKPSLSPRTSRSHQLFDLIKNSENTGEKVILAPAKSSGADLRVYNYDSDESNFEKNYTQFKKRSSTTTVDDNTISTKRGRVTNKIDYHENVEIFVNEPVKVTKKSIQHKNTNRKGKKKNTSKTNLIDERIRKASTSVMNNSLTSDVNKEQILEEPVFTLQSKPQMEILEESIHNESVNTKPKKPIKNNRHLSLRKRVPIVKVSDKRTDDEMTERSNPSFLIEDDQSHRDDLNESVFNIQVNMLDKLNKAINQEGALNDKHVNPGFEKDEDNAVCDLIQEHNVTEHVQCLEITDASEKSIKTMGNSPINAHGDLDEAPPSPDLIQRAIQARDLDTEYLRQSLKDYVNIFSKNDSEASDHRESNTYIGDKNHANSVKSDFKSPVVSVTRLSSREIRKWIAKSRSSEWDSEEENVQPEITKEFASAGVQKSVKDNSSRSLKSSFNPNCKPLEKSQRNELRKSTISPIQLFEEVFPHKTNIIHSLSEDEDYMREINEYRNVVKPSNDKASSSNNCFIRDYKGNESKSNHSKQTKRSSVNSERSKRRRVELETDVTTSQSARSISNVQDWFKQQAARNVDDSEKQVEDCFEHIMEKLETTLEEINQNTTVKFIRMFVGVQEQLNSMKENLLELHQATAKSILSDVVKIMDEKFAELHNRSHQEYLNFKEDLKQNAVKLVKEDSKKKQMMVKLLIEDMKIVLDNMRSKNKTPE